MILPAMVAAVSAPIGAWVNSKLLKSKYNIEIDNMRAELETKLTDVKNSELDNVRKANDILVESVVNPLTKEIKTLRRDVDKFRKAVEKIPTCAMSDTCPVSRELQRAEARLQREQDKHTDRDDNGNKD